MSATFIEVAKFIADKLIIALIVLGATIGGNFLLEKYKMSSSISIADSNEIVKRLELLWAKAYEVEAEAYTITSLYGDMFNHEFIRPPLDELQRKIDTQKELMEAKHKEFWNLIYQSQFYLGERVVQHLIWYVSVALSLPKSAETNTRDVIDFANMLKDPVRWPIVNNEEYRKNHEENVSGARKSFYENEELTMKILEGLRFGYSAARNYSLR